MLADYDIEITYGPTEGRVANKAEELMSTRSRRRERVDISGEALIATRPDGKYLIAIIACL